MRIMPACFYHPTSVLFLDDNVSFLAALELKFHEKNNIITCTKTDEAIQLINTSEENINSNILKSIDTSEIDTVTGYLFNLEINNIHHLIYNKSRFDFISLLVVDYKMPIINGVEFCRHIYNSAICKIMLTAEADKEVAITAFNDGLIDKFLLKQNDNLYGELISSIDQLKQRYFHRLSRIILESLGKEFRALLASEHFQKIFSNVFEKSNAVEYYLMDTHGSFMFLDDAGNPMWLIIRSDKEITEQISLVEGLGASKEMISLLKNRQKLLFLFSEENYKTPISHWDTFLLDANILSDGHYYSVVNGRITDSIHWDAVASYNPCLMQVS